MLLLIFIPRDRNEAYHFFSGFYMKGCSEVYLETLSANTFPEVDGLLNQGYSKMKEYLDSPVADKRTELACDYAKVFLSAGIYEGDSASPYESVYTSEQHLLMQEARDDVFRLFLKEGIAPTADSVEESFLPEDHLSFELEFMAYCGEKAVEALRQNDLATFKDLIETQQEFLKTHLLNWVPAFCNDVRKLSRTIFYNGVADGTQGFLEADLEFLQNLEAWVNKSVTFR